MKKLLLASLFIAGMAVNGHAQKFEIGLKGGLNSSQVVGEGSGSDQSFWDSDASRTSGFTGGLFTRFGSKVYLQPEIMVSTKGGKAKDMLGFERDFKQTYFDIPVLLGVKVIEGLRINAGPIATFLINKDETFFQNIGLSNEESGFRKALLGYQMGLGVDIKKIRLDMRFEGNVNDVFNVNYDNEQTRRQFAGKSNAFILTAGFAF